MPRYYFVSPTANKFSIITRALTYPAMPPLARTRWRRHATSNMGWSAGLELDRLLRHHRGCARKKGR